MTFTPLQFVLPKVTRTLSLDRQAIAGQVCEEYRKHAATIVHADILANSYPKYFRNGVLKIAVHDAPWAQLIHWKKYDLKKAINAAIGGEVIREISTVIEQKQENPFMI